MNTTPIHAAAQPVIPPGITRASPDESFQRVLAGTDAELRERQADEAARTFVAMAFIEPMLQMMTDSQFAEGPFAPGDTERRFSPLLNQELAGRVVAGSRFGLVNEIKDRLLEHSDRGVKPVGESTNADD